LDAAVIDAWISSGLCAGIDELRSGRSWYVLHPTLRNLRASGHPRILVTR